MLGAWRAPLLNVGLGSLSGSSRGFGCVSRVPVPQDGSCSPWGAPCSRSGVSVSSMGSGVSLRGAREAAREEDLLKSSALTLGFPIFLDF